MALTHRCTYTDCIQTTGHAGPHTDTMPSDEALDAALARAEAEVVELRQLEVVDPSYGQRTKRIVILDGWIEAVKVLGFVKKLGLALPEGNAVDKAIATFVAAFPEEGKGDG